MPPLAELQKRPQDGISRVQKVAAVELGFCGVFVEIDELWVYDQVYL